MLGPPLLSNVILTYTTTLPLHLSLLSVPLNQMSQNLFDVLDPEGERDELTENTENKGSETTGTTTLPSVPTSTTSKKRRMRKQRAIAASTAKADNHSPTPTPTPKPTVTQYGVWVLSSKDVIQSSDNDDGKISDATKCHFYKECGNNIQAPSPYCAECFDSKQAPCQTKGCDGICSLSFDTLALGKPNTICIHCRLRTSK